MKADGFYKKVKKYVGDARVMLDIGSFNARDAVLMAKECPTAKVFAFECNPMAIKLCENHIKESKCKNVTLIKKAVSNVSGNISFYQAAWNQARGASSVLDSSGLYDKILPFDMTKIEVESTRIDDWAKENEIDQIDVVWADVQGAETQVFGSFGKLLNNIKAIHSEVLFEKLYTNCSLYKDLKEMLEKNGFDELLLEESPNGYWSDVIFINRDLI